jgi:hypothetical protein
MLHKAEEWKLIARASEDQTAERARRSLRLDDDAEKKLMDASAPCKWRVRTQELLFSRLGALIANRPRVI